jgi:hypothetical protein
LAGSLRIGQGYAGAGAAARCIGDDAGSEPEEFIGVAPEGGEAGDILGGETVAGAGVGGVKDGDFVGRDGDGLVRGADLKLQVDVARVSATSVT